MAVRVIAHVGSRFVPPRVDVRWSVGLHAGCRVVVIWAEGIVSNRTRVAVIAQLTHAGRLVAHLVKGTALVRATRRATIGAYTHRILLVVVTFQVRGAARLVAARLLILGTPALPVPPNQGQHLQK